MEALGKQMDSVFSHGLYFCIKNALLRVLPINLGSAASCPEIPRTGRFTFHCVYHLVRKCLPYLHLLYTLFLNALLSLPNFII